MPSSTVGSGGCRLSRSFYMGSAVEVARGLLGKVLVSAVGGRRTAGIIVETEAYGGVEDRASHAYGGRRTARTEMMYRIGGHAYVYLCYGMHWLFNVVTGEEGVPSAVLIRAIFPLEGWVWMWARRYGEGGIPEGFVWRRGDWRRWLGLGRGPGCVTRALGITGEHNGIDLVTSDVLWIEDRGMEVLDAWVMRGVRVGVDYAGEDARLPWRFGIRGSPCVSVPIEEGAGVLEGAGGRGVCERV